MVEHFLQISGALGSIPSTIEGEGKGERVVQEREEERERGMKEGGRELRKEERR